MSTMAWEDFGRVHMRVGEVTEVEAFPEARRPSTRMRIDFGPRGVKKGAAAVKAWYPPENLRGRQVVAVVHFAPKPIAHFLSEVRAWVRFERTGASSSFDPTTGPSPAIRSPRSVGREG